jgi:hypothetical protein
MRWNFGRRLTARDTFHGLLALPWVAPLFGPLPRPGK